MKETILIIAESDFLDLHTKYLKLGGFYTITSSNVEEALRVIEESYNDIAIILLDSRMPGFNMEKILQYVKSDERYKHILVKSFPEQKQDEGDSPFPYVFKPPTPPGDLGLAGEPQRKESVIKKVLLYETYCKHCGAKLPEGQTICHVCGKKIR